MKLGRSTRPQWGTVGRRLVDLLSAAAECIWPRPPAPHPAALYYFESQLSSARAEDKSAGRLNGGDVSDEEQHIA